MTILNDCGCCEGLMVETPFAISNRPGLPAIRYRAGTHSQFRASMLSRLSAADLSRLAALKTREEDDFTIALLDAWAVVADILTFYQERIANESYLRTATERQSIINLARLIGYELRPGVAASAYLAFTTDTGAFAPATITLDTGLKVQSVPGPGEKPQTFETVEEIEIRPGWNLLTPQQTEILLPAYEDTQVVLAGVTTNLRPGDALLIVGAERPGTPTSDLWQFRRISAVAADATNDRTIVQWTTPLAKTIPRSGPRVYALRLSASLFGYNAQDYKSLPVALRVGEANPDPTTETNEPFIAGAFKDKGGEWNDQPFAAETTAINLDSVYKQIVPDSWVVLASADDVALFQVTAVVEEAKTGFNLSAKTSRLSISGSNIEKFSPKNAAVYAQSEELALAGTPIEEPVWKKEIVLDRVVEGLQTGRTLIVSGRRMRATLATLDRGWQLASAITSRRVALSAGDSLIVASPPVDVDGNAARRRFELIDKTGFTGRVESSPKKVTFTPSNADDEIISEVVMLDEATLSDDAEHTILTLTESLANVYDRTTVTIYANVARSTHGESVKNEILGSGDAGRAYQHFALRQAPLTYTPADTASGGASTLEVRVNELKWDWVPTLYGRGPREHAYVTHIDSGGTTTVQFGDGRTGARLPMGRENVKATYRKGIGLDGLVDAGQLSLLMTRPLGLRGVVNPLPAAGAQDPQSLSDARTNAPVTVLTLDRIVSLQDYEDFARAFSGIAKAQATWTWTGHARRIFVTVAGIDGAAVDDKSDLQTNLISAMRKAGDEFVPITIKTYRPVAFKVDAAIKVDPAYIEEDVFTAVEAALRDRFSFSARSFGQPVTLSELIAVMQDVPGVVAVDVNRIYRSGDRDAGSGATFLPAASPQVGEGPSVAAAQLLTLSSEAIDLKVMS
jgi:hypothetical protein